MAGHELYQIKNDYKREIQTYLHSHGIGHHAFVQANAECHADVLPGQFRPADDHPPCGCLRHREAASYVGHHGGADGHTTDGYILVGGFHGGDFRIVRKDNEQLIASGTSQWNILNLDTKRLETTDFLADKLTVVPELMTASHKKVRFPKPQSFDMLMEHRATRLDLDFNFHVSNRSYVTIALLTMPDEVLASQTLASVIVHWPHVSHR